MPNLVGLDLQEAEAALSAAGVLNTGALGYFGTWPITVQWRPSNQRPGNVLAQLPASGATAAVNAAVALTVAEFPFGVCYP